MKVPRYYNNLIVISCYYPTRRPLHVACVIDPMSEEIGGDEKVHRAHSQRAALPWPTCQLQTGTISAPTSGQLLQIGANTRDELVRRAEDYLRWARFFGSIEKSALIIAGTMTSP